MSNITTYTMRCDTTHKARLWRRGQVITSEQIGSDRMEQYWLSRGIIARHFADAPIVPAGDCEPALTSSLTEDTTVSERNVENPVGISEDTGSTAKIEPEAEEADSTSGSASSDHPEQTSDLVAARQRGRPRKRQEG